MEYEYHMKRTHKIAYAAGTIILIGLLVLLALQGCGFVPTERNTMLNQEHRESTVGKMNSDIVRESKTEPPTLTIQTGEGESRVEVAMPVRNESTAAVGTDTEEKSKSDSASLWNDIVSIPLFVKLIGLAIGLASLYFVGKWLINASPAAKAGWSYGNEALARQINRLRDRATTEQDPKTLTEIQAAIASLEQERAELNKD